MQITSVAASALNAAGTAVNICAHNIVNAATPEFTAKAPVFGSAVHGGIAVFAQESGRPTNLASEVAALSTGAHQYRAAARLLAIEDELSKTPPKIA